MRKGPTSGSVKRARTRVACGTGRGLIVPGPPQQERSPDLGSLRAARRQILAAASRRGLRDVRVFGSVARGEAVETSDVDLLVAPGPDTTLFDLSGFALDVDPGPKIGPQLGRRQLPAARSVVGSSLAGWVSWLW